MGPPSIPSVITGHQRVLDPVTRSADAARGAGGDWRLRVLIADDHAIMRDGLRAILLRASDLEVIGEACDGFDVVDKAAALDPDVVIMDVTMPRLDGPEATRRLRDRHLPARIIALTMHAELRIVRAMFAAGADAYFLKSESADELLSAVRSPTLPTNCVSNALAQGLGREFAERDWRSPEDLSSRQREVLRLLAEGKTSKEVAAEMAIAVSTVETYRRQIAERLGLHSIAALTKFAIRHGLASLE